MSRTLALSLQSRLTPGDLGDLTLAETHRCGVLREAGVDLEAVLKTRPDTRAVLLVRHPRYGRCVLKTVFDVRYPARGLNARELAEMARPSEGGGIFPVVYEASTEHTLEQYVDGRPFREWMENDFDIEVVRAFVESLREFGAMPHSPYRGRVMRPCETREITRSYVEKCLQHMRFFSMPRQARSSRRLLLRAGHMRTRLAALSSLADELVLPRGVMCGDMGNVNLVVQESPHRVYNIDYERMGPGHWGFDLAYFLSSLAKLGGPPEPLAMMRKQFLAEEYLGDRDAVGFFTGLTDLLSDLSREVYRDPRR